MNNNTERTKTPKIAEDVVIPEPQVFADPDFTNGEPTLSDDEVAFFKENGFLVKRGFLDDDKTFERIVDYVWENVPRNLFSRNDPKSWTGSPKEKWTEEDDIRVGQIQGNTWKMRSRDVIGTEPFLLGEIGNHPRMRKMVSLFLGEPVKTPERVRGVYGVFPAPPGTEGRLSPHADHTAADLSAMVIVDEIPPHSGGFTIWPGSHHVVHPHADTAHGSMGPDRVEAYALARDAALRKITPVEFPGSAGDVIFWHPRLMHSGGTNRSADRDQPVLRLIVPCDYQRADRTFFDDLVDGPGPNHQWWVDTRNFHEDVPPTPENIWDGWAFG
jgi:hypothetical protein